MHKKSIRNTHKSYINCKRHITKINGTNVKCEMNRLFLFLFVLSSIVVPTHAFYTNRNPQPRKTPRTKINALSTTKMQFRSITEKTLKTIKKQMLFYVVILILHSFSFLWLVFCVCVFSFNFFVFEFAWFFLSLVF